MNKKILRKLTLSAVTLGVAALSVTTSTFAWFTTNGSATASEVKGTVQAANANMLIKTKTTSGYTDFKNSVSFDAGSTTLVPVTWSTVDSGTPAFHKAGNTIGEFKENANTSTDVLHYEVVFGITNLPSSTATVTANFTNFSGGEDATQYLLVDACASGTTNGATAGTTIKVNLLDVLSLRVTSTVISSDLSTYGISDSNSNLVGSINPIDANYRYKKEVETLTEYGDSKLADGLTGNAIDYYKNVYGSKLTGTMSKPQHTSGDNNTYADGYSDTVLYDSTQNGESQYKDITLFTVPANNTNKTVYVKTDFYFYIDGWDYQCFNCVGGLTLSGGVMNFKLS